MPEEKEESVIDTVTAAVNEQRSKSEEPVAQAEPAPEPADSKPAETAIPEEQPEEVQSDGRERDAQGRFKPKGEQQEAAPEGQDEPKEPEEAVRPDIARPPKRLPVRTKAIWSSLSPNLREDIIARETEFDKAFKRYDGLGQFANQAETNGTTLHKAVQDYSAMETALRNDPIQGAITVWRRMGYDPYAVLQEMFRRAGPQEPNAQSQPQQVAPQQPQEDIEATLERKLSERDNQAKIAAFEADPRIVYLEPLVPGEPLGPVRATMVGIMERDQTLANDLYGAYDVACRARGLPTAQPNGDAAKVTDQAKKAAAANQARSQAKATVGAPAHSSNVNAKLPDGEHASVLDTVRAAYRRQIGE